MNVKVENAEKNTAKIIVEVSAAEFDEGIDFAYKKNKNKFNIPGFRKGHVRKEVIERMYGTSVFFEDAVNYILDKTYPQACEQSGLDIVSRPEVEVGELKAHEGFTYTATVAVRPEVTLGEYKGISVVRASSAVSEEDVDREIERIRDQNARIVSIDDENREIASGDIAVIKYDGYVDGKAFEGGSGDDYSLTIGSHSFIDTFEDQLIGHKKGDEVDVNVTFPIPYQAKELEGKPALFKVVVKEIKEKQLPELDDEFAEEVSEFETLAEYRASVQADLKVRAEKSAAQANENNVVAAVVANASVDIPDAMVDYSLDNMIQDYSRRLKQQGMKFEDYLQYMGTDLKGFKQQQTPYMVNNIKKRLVLEDIVKAEGIEAPEDALNERLAQMARQYELEVDRLKEILPEEQLDSIKLDLAVKEAVDFLVAEAVLTEPTAAEG